ncbi:MAG TPA: hypothetical protein VHL98_14895 [Microvirga sp.]|nr:hypothetical protein [Microvirga sp.]
MTRHRLRAAAALAATAILGLVLARGAVLEAWYFVFVLASGLAAGSLGLLMIGHLMSEEWLKPVRSEAEAAALTLPLVATIALPLAFALGELYPWAGSAAPPLPPGRAAFLSAPFFLARGALYLAAWTALALWITRTRHPRRTSAIGLAILAPTVTFAANDWVLSREPLWWSGLYGFSFALSQLLAALAGAILISLLRPEHPSAVRMQSLERALLSLALLALWAWFAPFLIVWLGNLPHEAAWYVARMGPWLWPFLWVALPALAVAVAILVPPGFGRRTMIAGSALILLHHGAHMLWLLGPAARQGPVGGLGALVGVALAGLWAAWFVVVLRGRPTFEEERGRPPG